MTVARRAVMVGICAVVMGSLILPAVMRGAEPATAPAARSDAAIEADLKATSAQLQDVMPSIRAVVEEGFRKGDGQKAIVPLKKIVGLMGELGKSQTDADAKKDIEGSRYRYQSILVAMGDGETIKSLEATAGGADAKEAVSAKSALALGKWWASSTDATAQAKELDDYVAIAKANPANDDVAITLMVMGNLGAATDDLKNKAIDVIKTTLTGETAKGMLAQIAASEKQDQEMADAEKAQAQLVGKPLAVEGRTSTDGKFALGSLKGKVVLVDFWATWCGPCVAGLPEVKGVYAKYHDKGMEIVGVSCDSDEDALNAFTKENAMPWVQLHDKAAQSGDDYWHPLTHKFGVMSIPTMFLVDKKGILRYVDAREDLEKKVGELLAEKDGAGTQPSGK